MLHSILIFIRLWVYIYPTLYSLNNWIVHLDYLNLCKLSELLDYIDKIKLIGTISGKNFESKIKLQWILKAIFFYLLSGRKILRVVLYLY